MSIEHISVLRGNSGCEVHLYRERGAYFVRKRAKDQAYNDRLRKQAAKQASYFGTPLRCPKIISDGEIDGTYFFDMEYVQGSSVLSSFQNLDTGSLSAIERQICAAIDFQAQSWEGSVDESLFAKKITSVLDHAERTGHEGIQSIRQVGRWLQLLDWSAIPASRSHGDMTLENMIVDRRQNLYFIDFLDGEASSFWLDVAKIHQDLECLWFLRHLVAEPGSNAAFISLGMVARDFGRQLDRYFLGNWPEIAHVLPQLICFQLFRIFPYCRDEQTFEFLLRSFHHIQEESLQYVETFLSRAALRG